MITLSVDLRVRPGHLAPFLAAIELNAARSFGDEPGCVSFDVSQDLEDSLHIVLFEVYADEAAVEAHRGSQHFADWDRAAGQHVEPGGRTRVMGTRLFHHGGEGR